MRKRTIAIVGATAAAILAAAILGVVIGPRLLETEIESRLKTRLEARGIHATWGDFQAHGGRSFEIDDVRVEVPRYGAVLESERIIVSVAIGSVWAGDVRLTEVSLEPARVRIDVEKALESREPSEVATGSGAQSSGGLIQRILENPPVVHLTQAELLVTRGEEDLLRVGSPLIAVEESWGDFEVQFDGEVQILADRTPELLRSPIPWRFAGKIAPDEGTFEYRVTSPTQGSPLLRVDIDELLGVEVANVWGQGHITDRTAAVNVENIEIVIGGDQYAALHARAPRAVVSRQRSGRPRIELIDPSVYATPSKRGKLRDALTYFRPQKDPAQAESPRARRQPSTFSRVAKLAAQTDFELRGLSVGVHLENEDGSHQTLTLLERLDTTLRDGHMRTNGSTAGGKFYAEAEVLPGQSWPHYLIVRADDMHLEKIPGLARKRSNLPSRGTSGTIAGVVDLDLALTMPSQGMTGPMLQPPGIGEFRIRWTNGTIDLEGVADVPVTDIDTSAGFAFVFHPELAWLEVPEGFATYGPMRVNIDGKIIDFPLDPTLSFDFELEEIECQQMFRAFPKALLGPYANIEFEGAWAPKGWFRFPLLRPRGLRYAVDEESYADLCKPTALNADKEAWPEIEIASRSPTGPHKHAAKLPKGRSPTSFDDVYWLNRPFIKRVTEGLSSPEVELYVGPGTPEYVPLEKLPRWVGGAAYLSEQIDFYVDGPISLSLMRKAMRLNLDKGRFEYGGSTVTQQLVKNLFLSRDKTLARKFQEALISWRIDEVVSKDRVLELYLNCIEFGNDVYGIGPAARHYFQKDARYLTPKEAIFLAMLKPAPWFGESIMQRGKTPNGEYFTKRIAELHDRLVEYEFITQDQSEREKPYTLEWEDGRYKGRSLLESIPLLE